MLTEWYFCCCISSNPSATEAFLSILHCLDDAESEPQLLYLVFHELEYTDDRMQIYALPRILKLLDQENLPTGLKHVIRRYLNHLLENIPESVESSVRRLVRFLDTQPTSTKLIEAVDIFVRESQDLPDRRLGSTPYIDLKDFLPETLVLAVLANLLDENSSLSNVLAEAINEQDGISSPVSELLQAALEYQFGRMAFRLAVLIFSLINIEYPQDIRTLMTSKASTAAYVEPDLLQTYAIALFSRYKLKLTSRSQCRRILYESQTLSELRTLIKVSLQRNPGEVDALLRRVGVKSSRSRISNQSLPIFYWQILLWELSAKIDVIATADMLGDFLLPGALPSFKGNRRSRELYINCSSADDIEHFSSQFESLLKIQEHSSIKLKVKEKREFHLHGNFVWLFLSPWITRTNKNNNLYPTLHEPVLLIRLMGSTYFAIYLLKNMANNSSQKFEFAARLLAHASDVMTSLERYWGNGKIAQFEPSLMGLFYFVKREIKRVGTGQIESIDPQNFVNICDRSEALSTEQSRVNSEEITFLNSVLPEVLISWILDAYPSAIGSQLTGRWLRLVPPVYEYHISKHHTFDKHQKAALVTRFLCPQYSLQLDDNLDWRNQRDKDWKKSKNWKVDPHQLLLTRQLHPSEWRNIECDERIVWGGNHSRENSSQLVYYLELLDAIGHVESYDSLNEYESEESDKEIFFSKWRRCLNSIGNTKNLDHLVRLRLLEFLDSPILNGQFEEQFLLSSVLIEYGSIYDLNQLFERIYPIDTDGISLQDTESARQRLQIELLPIIWHRLEQGRQLLQEIDHDHEVNYQNQDRKVQNPQGNYTQIKDVLLCQDWLNKLVYLSSIPKNDDNFGALNLGLNNLRKAALNRQVTGLIRSATFNVELRNKQKRLVQAETHTLPDLTIRAINYNPNQLTAKVFYEDFDTTGTENLFEKSFDDLQNLNYPLGSSINVLAVVVSVVRKEKREKYGWEYTFDCGFHFLLKHFFAPSFSSYNPFELGDRVKLPIRLYESKAGAKPYWGVDFNIQIRSLSPSFKPGDINQIYVSEIWKGSLRLLHLKHNQEIKRLWDEEIKRLWDADVSREFHRKIHSHNRTTFAQLNAQKKWVPLDLEFSDLLFQIVHSQAENQIVVLTLIEETINQFREKAWRFSRIPGENYLIEHYRFLEDSVVLLEDEIARYDTRDGAFGLLVSVESSFVSDQVGLKLVASNLQEKDRINEFYPSLRVPFDDRNIRWRTLFNQAGEGLTISKDQHGNWFYQIPESLAVPGYPGQVRVKFQDKPPRSNQRIADFIAIEWNDSQWREGFVIGEAVFSYSIRPQKKNWVDFLDRWLSMPVRQHIQDSNQVKITKLLGDIDQNGDGFVAGLTDENMFVRIQAESLTMLPLNREIKLQKARNAEILRIDWNNTEFLPDIENPEQVVPPEAIQDHQCIGILTLVSATRETHGTQCQVVWRVQKGSICEQPLQINNLAKLRIRQGCQIIGTKKNGQWTFEIKKPTIRVRALWTLKSWEQGILSELYYLGKVLHRKGENLILAESPSCPGELICLPNEPQEIFHLARCKGTKGKLKFKENLVWEENRAKNTARNWYADDEPLRSGYRRAILKLNNRLLIGNYNQWIDNNHKVSVQAVNLVLSSRDDQQYVLRRRFNLRPIREIKKQESRAELSNIDLWQKNLNSYLRKPPEPLRATFSEEQGVPGFWLFSGISEIRVPVDTDRNEWTLWVPLAPEHGPFVVGADYSNQAKIILIPQDERIMASCREIQHLDLDEFKVTYCESSSFETDIFLLKDKDIHLYFVGPETVNPKTGQTYDETHYRFEIGYGETLLIPESQLEFNDDTFDKAQFSLFYGDLIKVISFKHIDIEKLESEETGQEEEKFEEFTHSNSYENIILNIKGIYIQWSEARQIFEQRKRYKIVHLLHLNPQSEKLEISYIDGFNENTVATQRRFDPKKFKALLTSDSEARLSPRIRKWTENSDPVIYGRLDENRYRQSNGRDIYFEHVRLSFQYIEEESSSLQDGELVFLRAGKIKPIRNDMVLTLQPPKGFDLKDTGTDTKDIAILRRDFSVRENLLKQVYQEEGSTHFQDDPLLIKLTLKSNLEQNNLSKIIASLLIKGSQTPARKMSALTSAISYHRKSGLLATVVQVNTRGTVQIEYKPGIFVRLEPEQIQSCSDNLLSGAMVRIDIVNDMLNITRAVFSHAKYVPQKTRPVVIFPTNDIRRLDRKDWARQSRFVIGGLSNLVAHSGYPTTYHQQKLLSPQAIAELLMTQHPKVAQLSTNNKGRYFVAPLEEQNISGCLKLIENSLAVQYVSFDSECIESQPKTVLPWHLLSFADESAHQILERSTAYSWKYHDETTFTWSSDVEEFQLQKLQKHSVWTGPLFFQSTPKGLRLRYGPTEFRRFGFPVGELISALKQEAKVQRYPVAGVSQSEILDAEKPEYSLWIELVPGRLVELPTQLIFWQSGQSDKYQSLANVMHWQGFAPGDYVELELISTDPLTIDRIVLRNWISGIRHALGPNRSFLPVEMVAQQQGKLILGHGNVMITLPFLDADPSWHMVILTAENDIYGIQAASQTINSQPRKQPARRDVVLLSISDQGKVVVLGFEDMTPLFSRNEAEAARSHPITGSLFREGREGLKSWIQAVGGGLPVTVEGLHRTSEKHLLYFSMRHQQDAALIPLGKVSIARFVNLLPDQKTAMFFCSGGFITLPMASVVPGLNSRLYPIAAEEFKQLQVLLWLRRNQNGKFTLGLYDDSEALDLLVESLDILLTYSTEDHVEIGLICQSIKTKTLHWLPIEEAAWTKLSAEEFRQIFQAKGNFKVRRKFTYQRKKARSIISFLAEPDVYAESKTLTVGQELFVQVIQVAKELLHNEQRYLVESVATQAILDCEIYDNQTLDPGDTLSVEVVNHIKGKPELITVAPVGTKRQYLDLPNWMTQILPEPGEHRRSIKEYIRWRKGLKPRRDKNLANQNIKREYLNQLLCHYFNDIYGTLNRRDGLNSEPSEKQLQTAQLWAQQNRYESEIYVVFAIMAILLLHRHDDTRRQAYKLAQDLGQRALRSLHIETLYEKWLRRTDDRRRGYGLWRRLEQLYTEGHFSIPLKLENSEAIRQFCNAVEMKADQDILPISKSLSAALGEIDSFKEINDHSSITIQLINLYLTLHPKSKIKILQVHHIQTLQDILEQIDRRKLDIMFLEPLEQRNIIDSQFKELEETDLLSELFPKNVEEDWVSWKLRQVIHLEDLTDQYVSLQDRVKKLGNWFHKIHLLGE